jgi:phasin
MQILENPARKIGARRIMMAQETSPQFGIPPEMRAMAEQSVEQAKSAFNSFLAAAHEAMATFEGHAKVAQAGAKGVGDKAMSYAERNVAATFEFAQKLMRANDIQDFVRLQTEFVQSQVEALTEQAKELGEAAAKASMPPR